MIDGATVRAALDGPNALPWPRVAISDIARTSSGTTPSRRRAERYFAGGAVPWVKTLDLRNGEISVTDECVTDLAVQETSLQVYPPGTVLVAMYGGFNQIGRTGLLRISACVNQALSAIQVNRNRVVPEYLLAVLNFRVQHWRAVASSSRKDPNITGNDVRAFELPLPPTDEQRSIAAALADIDALLAKLDLLIAKKRDVKQAAMQQLLTGQVRLAGFTAPWKGSALREVAFIRNDKALPSTLPPETVCIELEHIGQGTGRLVGASVAGSSSSAKYRFAEGDVLFGRLRAYLRKHWLADRAGICSTEIWPLVGKPNRLAASYLSALVQTDRFADAAAVSYGTHMPRADWSVIGSLKFQLPPFEEQHAIGSVIRDLDAELAALESRRDKTCQLKQGMMQALLTGRIRLT